MTPTKGNYATKELEKIAYLNTRDGKRKHHLCVSSDSDRYLDALLSGPEDAIRSDVLHEQWTVKEVDGTVKSDASTDAQSIRWLRDEEDHGHAG